MNTQLTCTEVERNIRTFPKIGNNSPCNYIHLFKVLASLKRQDHISLDTLIYQPGEEAYLNEIATINIKAKGDRNEIMDRKMRAVGSKEERVG